MDDLVFGGGIAPSEIYSMTISEITAHHARYMKWVERTKPKPPG